MKSSPVKTGLSFPTLRYQLVTTALTLIAFAVIAFLIFDTAR